MHQTVLIEDLAVVLCIAAIVIVLFQKIKQPIVLGYLIAGIIIGPYTPPFSLIDDEAEIRLLAQLGVIFLMFSLGLEFTFNKLTRLGFAAIIIGVFEVFFMLMIGFFAGQLIGWSSYENLLLGAALSISSTTIIIKALEEYKLKNFSFSELMIGVLLIEDLLAILLLVYINTTGLPGSAFSNQILFTSLKLLLVISSWFLLGYLVLPYIMRKIQNYINHETLTIISIGLCLFLSSIAIYFHYSPALGAFIMGTILAETPLAYKINELTLPIRDIFAAVFFVSVGMLINPLAILNYWNYILFLSFITIVGKILTSGLGSVLAGQSISDSVRIGFSMAQIGEFSFIIIGIGSSMTILNESLYPIIVSISAITTFTTPYLMKFGIKVSEKAEKAMPPLGLKLLKRYHKGFTHLSEFMEKHSKKVKNSLRFIINSIIVAIIGSVCGDIVIPHFFPAVNKEWSYQLLFWLIISILTSPFIWAMLYAGQPVRRGKGKIVIIIRWLIVFGGLCTLAFIYFTFPLLILPLAALLYVYFKLFFSLIKSCYTWLENNLHYNLTHRFEMGSKHKKI